MRARALYAAGPVVGLVAAVAWWRWSERPLSRIDVRDSFDEAELSRIWETTRVVPGRLQWQSEVVRAGRGALRFLVGKGDRFEAGQGGSKDSERTEIAEISRLYSREGVPYEFSFSLYLPAEFPIVPVRLVVAQWKQHCGGQPQCSDDSPVLALRYIGGELRVTRTVASKQTEVLFAERADLRGKWTDFRFQVLFAPNESGFVRAWRNGASIVDVRGRTAYLQNDQTGYSRPGRYYFKTGLYRDTMDAPMTMYLDEYSKRELPAGGAAQ